MKKRSFYIILTLLLILIPFGFNSVKAADITLTRDYFNIDGCKKDNTVTQCKGALLDLVLEIDQVLSHSGIYNEKIDYAMYPSKLQYIGKECLPDERADDCKDYILSQIEALEELNKLEFSCSYTSQVDGSTLAIDKYPNWWMIGYPDKTVDLLKTSDVGLGMVLPTSACEDIFYVVNKGTLKAIEANTSYTGTSVAQVCNGYGNVVEQFCESGNCKIINPICGSSSNSDNNYGECPSELKPAIIFLKRVVFNTVQILVPILLILMGSIDLVKAVIAGDDKGGKDAVSKFIKRILAAVLVFFVTTIVSIAIGMLAKTDIGAKDDWKACWNDID